MQGIVVLAHVAATEYTPTCGPMVKELEWIETVQLAVSSILFKSHSLKLS